MSLFSLLLFPLLAQNTCMTPDTALKKLLQGNERYANDESHYPRRCEVRRQTLVSKQEPFGIVLGCSDSRVPLEIIFDQGVGDLFIVRVAGNVLGPLELDSIEFASIYLGASIIFVLGHENCGAVQAVLKGQRQGIENVACYLAPAIATAEITEGNKIENAVKANVRYVVAELKKNPTLSALVDQGKLDIVGGYYNLQTGKVSLLTE